MNTIIEIAAIVSMLSFSFLLIQRATQSVRRRRRRNIDNLEEIRDLLENINHKQDIKNEWQLDIENLLKRIEANTSRPQ